MAGSYKLSNARDGKYRIVLKAGNAEIILASELYKTRAAAGSGIASVKSNGPTTTIKDFIA